MILSYYFVTFSLECVLIILFFNAQYKDFLKVFSYFVIIFVCFGTKIPPKYQRRTHDTTFAIAHTELQS